MLKKTQMFASLPDNEIVIIGALSRNDEKSILSLIISLPHFEIISPSPTKRKFIVILPA
jgi:hypothetical protein